MRMTQYLGEAFRDACAAVVDPNLEDADRISDDACDTAFLFQNAILSEAGLIAGDEIRTRLQSRLRSVEAGATRPRSFRS